MLELMFSGFEDATDHCFTFISEVAAYRVHDGLLSKVRTHRDAARTIACRVAAVEVIPAAVGRADDHPRTARCTAEDAKAREQPFTLGAPAARRTHALDSPPRVRIDKRRTGRH